jgi:excinuclease ABC subunit B
MKFDLKSNFSPTGDQPQAIKKLCQGIKDGVKHQVLLGITGSGKTFVGASVIQQTQKPVLILSPNKTLAAQLYQEFQQFFPNNFVGFFVSYYDYYQPEAYMPTTDTYIAKDAKINKYIEELRSAAVSNLLSRDDVIIIASVSAIYGAGDPDSYKHSSLKLKLEDKITRQELSQKLVTLQYENKTLDPDSGCFRFRDNILEIFLPMGSEILEIEFEKDVIKRISTKTNILRQAANKLALPELKTNYQESTLNEFTIYPATLFFTEKEKIKTAMETIKVELKEELAKLKKQKKTLEYERLKRRTNYDLEMLKTTGYCNGIENYSRHLTFKQPGDAPFTLLGYYQYRFKNDFLVFVDESHIGIPQLEGMY